MPTKKRIALALIIIAISFFIFPSYYFSYIEIKEDVDERYDDLTKPQEPYNFEIPMYFKFNESSHFGRINETDFAFLLSLTYPNGTLVVNEPITVNATAVIDKVVKDLDFITLIFPNALSYPKTYGENRLPLQGILTFTNPINIEGGNFSFHNIYVSEIAQISFPCEGDYVPLLGLFFKNQSSIYYTAENVVLHVYPKEQLTEYDNQKVSLSASQASLRLSEAVFVLGLISIIALILQILDHPETKSNNTKNTTNPQDNTPKPKKDKTKGFAKFRKKHK